MCLNSQQAGVALRLSLRLQLNLLNGDLRFYDEIGNFSFKALPLVWIELVSIGLVSPAHICNIKWHIEKSLERKVVELSTVFAIAISINN